MSKAEKFSQLHYSLYLAYEAYKDELAEYKKLEDNIQSSIEEIKRLEEEIEKVKNTPEEKLQRMKIFIGKEDLMKVNYVFLEPIHPYAYRRPDCNIPLISGFVEVEPEDGIKPRLCFETTYEDGYKDYVPTSEVDAGNYKFVVQ